MAALLTLYPNDFPSTSVLLREGESPVAGRDPESDIALADSRASSRHARFLWRATDWWVLDLGSKNGTFVNGRRVRESELKGEDWISFGGLNAQYIVVTDVEMSAFLAGRAARRRSSGEIRLVLERATDAASLLASLVESSLAVAAAARGSVLVATASGPLYARDGASNPQEKDVDAEDGSLRLLTAAERVLSTGRTAIAGDAPNGGKGPGLPPRGAAALACIPLREADHVVGILTVREKRAGLCFSDLEVQFLESLADSACQVLNRLHVELREMGSAAVLVGLEES